jgi:hypothetical protein
MHRVKVRRTGLHLDEVAGVIRDGLGAGFQVEPEGDALKVSKGLSKATVQMREESGGTVFEVRGNGTYLVIPFSLVVTKMRSERGVAKRTADIIDGARQFAG